MWDEIQDMPAEIFDISDEDREEMAKVFAMTEEEYDCYWNNDQMLEEYSLECAFGPNY